MAPIDDVLTAAIAVAGLAVAVMVPAGFVAVTVVHVRGAVAVSVSDVGAGQSGDVGVDGGDIDSGVG